MILPQFLGTYKKLLNFFIRRPELLLTFIFIALQFVVPNAKVLFLLTVIFVTVLFLIKRSIIEVIILAYAPISLVQVGQYYSFVAVPSYAISIVGYPDGRIISFYFSPYFYLLIFCFLVSLYLPFLQKRHSYGTYFAFLGYGVLGIVSSLTEANFPYFSLGFSFVVIGQLAFFNIVMSYVSVHGIKELFETFFYQNFLVILFAAMLAFAQLFFRNNLGLYIEQATQLPQFGAGADESFLLFRSVSVFAHSNIFANWLHSIVLTLLLIYNFLDARFQKENARLLAIAVVISFFATLSTLSRAAFLSYIPLIILYRKNLLDLLFIGVETYRSLRNVSKMLLLLVSLVFCWQLVPRVYLSIFAFSQYGGWGVRAILNEEAYSMIQQHFLYGVGVGMFIPMNYLLHPQGTPSYFPESVHNGFILLLAERGILAVTILLFGYYVLLKEMMKIRDHRWTMSTIMAGLVGQGVFMFLHPFDNSFSMFTIVALTIGYWHESNKSTV